MNSQKKRKKREEEAVPYAQEEPALVMPPALGVLRLIEWIVPASVQRSTLHERRANQAAGNGQESTT